MDFLNWLIEQYKDDNENLRKLQIMKENVLNILALLEPALSSKYDDIWKELKKLMFVNKPICK